jgi:hypothetical protein
MPSVGRYGFLVIAPLRRTVRTAGPFLMAQMMHAAIPSGSRAGVWSPLVQGAQMLAVVPLQSGQVYEGMPSPHDAWSRVTDPFQGVSCVVQETHDA